MTREGDSFFWYEYSTKSGPSIQKETDGQNWRRRLELGATGT